MFLYPQFLYSIPFILILLALLYMYSRRNRHRRIRMLAQLHVDQKSASNHSILRSRLKLLLNLGGIILLLIALARPQFGFEWVEQRKTSRNILFILDISKSMLVEDIFPNRLDRAKLIIRDLVQQHPEAGNPGLLVFAGGIFLQCPPTEDVHAFLDVLEVQSPELLAQQGTDFFQVLIAIPEIITSRKNDIVILISDGEDHSTRLTSAIRYLQNESIRLHTICIGTTEGGLIPNLRNRDSEPYFFGNHGSVVFSRAVPETMAGIASALDGVFVHKHSERASLLPLHHLLEDSSLETTAAQTDKRIPVEHYQIPLLLALLLLLVDQSMGTRKRIKTQQS